MYSRNFQLTLRKLSVLKFALVEIETSIPIRFVLCTETETMLIQKEEYMINLQSNNNIYYYGVSSKHNFDIIGITSYMWKNITLKPYLLLMMS